MYKAIYGLLGLTLLNSPCAAGRHVDYSQCGIVDDSMAVNFRSPRPKSVSNITEELMSQEDPLESVNLSSNYILDEGAEVLYANLWKRGALPKLKELDLSFNRIGLKGLSFFEEVLDRPEFQYLNIVGNPAASVEAKTYFTQVSKERLRKLIWLPENWIDSKNWRILLSDRSDLSEVTQYIAMIHRKYYEEKNREIFEGAPISLKHSNPTSELLPHVFHGDIQTLEQDYDEAITKEDSHAAARIGERYLHGHTVRKDKRKAFAWFKYAASLGDVNSLFSLGQILIAGGRKDEGMKFITEAAKNWHFGARRMLGWIEDSQSSEVDVY